MAKGGRVEGVGEGRGIVDTLNDASSQRRFELHPPIVPWAASNTMNPTVSSKRTRSESSATVLPVVSAAAGGSVRSTP